MARGGLAGAIVGVLVSGIGAAGLSIAMGPPDPNRMARVMAELEAANAPMPEAQDAVTGDEAAASATPGAARKPEAEDEVAVAEPAPELSEPPEAPEAGAPDTKPALRPDAVANPQAPEAPDETGSTGAQIAVVSDAPVMPGGQAQAPEAPTVEAGPDVATEPAEPPMPATDDAPEPETSASEPTETEPAEKEQVAEAEIQPDAAPEPEGEPAPDVPVETAPSPSRDTAPDETAALPQEEPAPAGLTIGKPATSLIERGGTSSRLPTVGSDDGGPDQAEEAGAEAVATDADPLVRFAAKSDVPAADQPRMAIVLIDDGSSPLGPDTIDAFPFPVSFAIAPSHPDPQAAAQAYYDRGFEVLALAGVPEGAQASDVEVTLEAALASVPTAVGILEDPASGLQASRAVSDQATSYAGGTGHGLLMLPQGLNTAQALAQRQGVPSATVFRDFDGEGQSPRVMRRFLDQAAFKARQEGAVVMLGRLQADTVSALLLWGLQDRADSVAMVPVSVVLRESVAKN